MTPSEIWSVAEVLRGDWRASEYGKVILPFTVLRRLDQVLSPVKVRMLEVHADKLAEGVDPEPWLRRVDRKIKFWNVSRVDFGKLVDSQTQIEQNLIDYLDGFSPVVRGIFENFEFRETIAKLSKQGILYQVVVLFNGFDLSPAKISNAKMGDIFEGLIHKFAESANDGAGEFYTPREIVRLSAQLLFALDDGALTRPGIARSIYDPTSGTGGMLSETEDTLKAMNPSADVSIYGQELNPFSFAICQADLLIKGHDVSRIFCGNTLSEDGHASEKFDYMIANPPYGVNWAKVKPQVEAEHRSKGFAGRFGAGLPRVNDGSFLFMQHLISKMRPTEAGGSRIAIVLSGSPLFTGGAGSGESEIRRWLFENDMVEAIIQLPTDIFYNTGISTYVWLITNAKSEERRGKVQLIDASAFSSKMKKSMGMKRREISEADAATIVRLYGRGKPARMATVDGDAGRLFSEEGARDVALPEGASWIPVSLVFENEAFGYQEVTIERPKRDEHGDIVIMAKGKKRGHHEPDPELRDTEIVPLSESVEDFVAREVMPYAEDAWFDPDQVRIGYEASFSKAFFVPEARRTTEIINSEIRSIIARIVSRSAGEPA